MFKFPLWIAQSKEKIIVYDANFKIIYETDYSLEEDQSETIGTSHQSIPGFIFLRYHLISPSENNRFNLFSSIWHFELQNTIIFINQNG